MNIPPHHSTTSIQHSRGSCAEALHCFQLHNTHLQHTREHTCCERCANPPGTPAGRPDGAVEYPP